ncbi:MAG: CDP-diacylglycerol--glycerol-3-phosphate 3-phosphatidyltransferase [Clostridia bacterium]|nr:CDP-diacylglycerol--glycerol-3-phosphate 3-phosphatidyltransferase [Clostridia bacterium]MEE1024449.1 CDP-diacylglycerol--glycerol-3-phosphate 3-phosphatidyltransferase [Acutalibacteraceae bacterium]
MNLPNKLTLARFIMTPIFLILMLVEFPHHYLAGLIVFIIASLTDYFDGKIARRDGLITTFGKFLDPIADKMLTTAAFLVFLQNGTGYGIIWIVFIVLAREFVVTSVRLISAGSGKIIAANIWGKLKTVMQMIAIIATIFFEYVISEFIYGIELLPVMIVEPVRIVCSILLWISAILTFIAGITYVIDNKEYINFNK